MELTEIIKDFPRVQLFIDAVSDSSRLFCAEGYGLNKQPYIIISHKRCFPLVYIPTICYHYTRTYEVDVMKVKMLRPDSKGRITLGKLAEGVSGFLVTESKNHEIILKPYSEIPRNEVWLYENKVALNKVKKGLEDAKLNKTIKKGSFSQYVDDEIE